MEEIYLVQTDLDPSLESDPENLNSNLMTDEFDLPMIFRFGMSFSKNLKMVLAPSLP